MQVGGPIGPGSLVLATDVKCAAALALLLANIARKEMLQTGRIGARGARCRDRELLARKRSLH